MNISMNNAVPTAGNKILFKIFYAITNFFAVNYTKFMSPIKNQFYCGSCYSFATAAVLEYQSRKAGLNHIYSEQNIVDCDSANYGCDGGWPTTAMYYVHENGISNGSTYTYDGQVGTCRRDSYPSIHKINKVCEINLENNEENLMKVVATIGPVAGVIVASDGLFNYGSGVFYDPTCDPDAFDHAIVRL